METLTCKICYTGFDMISRIPYSLPVCGHTFCESCLKSLIQPTNHLQTKISCPLCKNMTTNPVFAGQERRQSAELVNNSQSSFFNSQQKMSENIIPKNFQLIELLTIYQTENPCDHAEKDFCCFDQSCKNNGLFCFDCARRFHFFCKSKCVKKKEHLRLNSSTPIVDLKQMFDAKTIIENIQKQCDTMKELLVSIVRNHETMLAEFANTHQNIVKTPGLYFENMQVFDISNSVEDNRLDVELKNFEEFKDISSTISSLPDTFFKKTMNCLNEILINNVANNAQFYAENLKIDSKIMKTFKDCNPVLMAHGYFGGFRPSLDFDWETYLKEITDYSPEFRPTFETENNFGEANLEKLKNIVMEEILRKTNNLTEFENNVQKSLTKEIPTSLFRVRVQNGEFAFSSESKEQTCYFSNNILGNSNFCLAVSQTLKRTNNFANGNNFFSVQPE